MDGTQVASLDIAIQGAWRDRIQAPHQGIRRPADRRRVATSEESRGWRVEGGLPLVIGGEFVGAIGVSGVTGPQDSLVAAAGAAATATMK
jgi:uncharacterized protein GlcG (DUF336 family)